MNLPTACSGKPIFGHIFKVTKSRLKFSPFKRYRGNCNTRKWPVKFQDFRETGPWNEGPGPRGLNRCDTGPDTTNSCTARSFSGIEEILTDFVFCCHVGGLPVSEIFGQNAQNSGNKETIKDGIKKYIMIRQKCKKEHLKV